MKFFFTKTDSLYKIFKALEKIPSHREAEIFIDPDHSLFDNEWRGYQIKEIIEKNQIDATFVAQNKKNRDFFRSVGLNVNLEKEKDIKRILNRIYLFFFDIKKFHLHTYESKKYLFAVIFIFELLLILWILRFVISLIIPSAILTIQPSETTEQIIYNVRYYPYDDPNSTIETRFLYIPFYTWSLDYKYELTISPDNIKYITNPSHWKIKIYNKKETEYELIKDTQFITQNWLIFHATSDFVIPAWTPKSPSETTISVKADEYDVYNQLIGVRWNIEEKNEMRIRNLEESALAKDIWAETIEPFAWWSSESTGFITEKDIEQLSQKLTNQVYEKKLSIVNQNFSISWWILLPFDTITTTTFNNVELPTITDNIQMLKWTAYITYNYIYVMREDLQQIFMTYINERPLENNLLVKIDPNTIRFLKDSDTTNSDEIRKSWKIFTISTQVDVIQAYDFENDSKKIIPEIKDKIAWMSIIEARNYILSSYAEIWSVKITVPLRYDSIPVLKSRIKINYK